MVLEAVEDDLRGWRAETAGVGGERVARGKLQIEHVMPRKWQTLHWPLPAGTPAADRDAVIDTIGNLTLLTGRLNSKISNGPWLGHEGKKAALKGHDVLMLNRRLLEDAELSWDDDLVRERTDRVVEGVLRVWPVPAGHRSAVSRSRTPAKRGVELSDLIGAGLLEEGLTLHARRQRLAGRIATVLPDGGIDVDGVRYSSPSGAARAVAGNFTTPSAPTAVVPTAASPLAVLSARVRMLSAASAKRLVCASVPATETGSATGRRSRRQGLPVVGSGSHL